jgi:cell division protein FtsB
MPDDSPIRPPASPPPSSPAALRPLGITVYVCILLLVGVAGVKTWRDLSTVEAREAELRREIAASQAEIVALEGRIERLDTDPLALERLAREELGMVYPGDVVVVLPPEEEILEPEGAAEL